jgi:magnesium chelatase family protein
LGLPDKAVAEKPGARARRLTRLRLSLPAKRITVNLPLRMFERRQPFDLPIALATLAAMEVLPKEEYEISRP